MIGNHGFPTKRVGDLESRIASQMRGMIGVLRRELVVGEKEAFARLILKINLEGAYHSTQKNYYSELTKCSSCLHSAVLR